MVNRNQALAGVVSAGLAAVVLYVALQQGASPVMGLGTDHDTYYCFLGHCRVVLAVNNPACRKLDFNASLIFPEWARANITSVKVWGEKTRRVCAPSCLKEGVVAENESGSTQGCVKWGEKCVIERYWDWEPVGQGKVASARNWRLQSNVTASSRGLYLIEFDVPRDSSGEFNISADSDLGRAFKDPYWNTSWAYYASIQLNSTVASNLTDFPARVSLNTSNATLFNPGTRAYQNVTDATNFTWFATDAVANARGIKFVVMRDVRLVEVEKVAACTGQTAFLQDASHNSLANATNATGTTFYFDYPLSEQTTYYVLIGGTGVNQRRTNVGAAYVSYPIWRGNIVITASYDGADKTTYGINVVSVTTENTSVSGGCTNIRFSDASNSIALDYELDDDSSTFCGNATNNATYWVRTNLTGGTLDTIRVYAGNVDASSGANASGVWSADYTNRWSLNDDGLKGVYTDSTGNADLNVTRCTAAGKVYPYPVLSPLWFTRGFQIDAYACTSYALNASAGATLPRGDVDYTMSAALMYNDSFTANGRIGGWNPQVTGASPAMTLVIYGNPDQCGGGACLSLKNTNTISTDVSIYNTSYDTWYYATTYRYGGNTTTGIIAYDVSGSNSNSSIVANNYISATTGYPKIGQLAYPTELQAVFAIAEMRVRNVVSSEDWIAAEWAQISSFGSWIPYGSGNVVINSPSNGTTYLRGTATVSINFTATLINAISAVCSLYVNTELNATNSSALNMTPTLLETMGLANGTNYTFYVSCDDGAVANSSTQWFFVNSTLPLVSINAPANDTNYSRGTTTVPVNFTAILNASSANCSLYVNGVLNASNASVANGTATILNATGLLNSTYYLVYVSCTDVYGTMGNSSTAYFFVNDLNLSIAYPGNRTSADFMCFQPNMNNTQPDGQNMWTPIMNLTNPTNETYYNITIALSPQFPLPSGFSIRAQRVNYVHPGSILLNDSGQKIVSTLASNSSQSASIWLFGECVNVSDSLSTQIKFIFAKDE
ncbi:MAG: hypothetical protein M0R66_01350 [Candidatus Omnitrophica bacterium]|nr:hypothetical protein [Candidatus Omnitrophota bacterium]